MRDPVDFYYNNLVPIVIEQSARGERSFDRSPRLLRERIIFVVGAIEDISASLIVAQLLFLEADNPKKEVAMYINSPGGVVKTVDRRSQPHDAVRTAEVTRRCGSASLRRMGRCGCWGKGDARCLAQFSRSCWHQPSRVVFRENKCCRSSVMLKTSTEVKHRSNENDVRSHWSKTYER